MLSHCSLFTLADTIDDGAAAALTGIQPQERRRYSRLYANERAPISPSAPASTRRRTYTPVFMVLVAAVRMTLFGLLAWCYSGRGEFTSLLYVHVGLIAVCAVFGAGAIKLSIAFLTASSPTRWLFWIQRSWWFKLPLFVLTAYKPSSFALLTSQAFGITACSAPFPPSMNWWWLHLVDACVSLMGDGAICGVFAYMVTWYRQSLWQTSVSDIGYMSDAGCI